MCFYNTYSLFSDDVCTKKVYTTEGNGHHDIGIDTSVMNYMTFTVKTCRDAHITLSETPNPNINAYEIVIGENDNQQSSIEYVYK